MTLESTANFIFPSPEKDILTAIEVSITAHFGIDWFFAFQETIQQVVEAISATDAQERSCLIEPETYLSIAMDAITAHARIQDNRLIFETFLKSLITLNEKAASWKSHKLIFTAQEMIIEGALQLHRSMTPPPVANIIVWWHNNLSFPLLSLHMDNNLRFRLFDVTAAKLAGIPSRDDTEISELPYFLSAIARSTFTSGNIKNSLLEHLCQSKSEIVLNALLYGDVKKDQSLHIAKFEMLPISAIANRRLMGQSRSVLRDDALWSDLHVVLPQLESLVNAYMPEASNQIFSLIRHTLMPFDKTRAIRWLSTACHTLRAWTKMRPEVTPESEPTVGLTFAYAIFKFVEPMQAADAKHLPRLPIGALCHSDCLADITMLESATSTERPNPPADLHFTANFFFIGLNFYHWVAEMIASADRQMHALQMQKKTMDSVRERMLRKILDGLYRQQVIFLAAARWPDFIGMLKQFSLFAARWLVHSLTGQTELSQIEGIPMRSQWKFVPQDVFSDISQVLPFCIQNDPKSFTSDEVRYWIHFTTLFVCDTSRVTHKYHRASYASTLYILCSYRNMSLDDQTCENVVHTVLRMYVDSEGLGQEKHTPRHHLNTLLNMLCHRYPKVVDYLGARANDHNDTFTKFISYSIADANYMLDDSIMTLKAMHTSFENGGDGGEPQQVESTDNEENAEEAERSTTREARIASLETHMEFTNQILLLVETLCEKIPAALLQGLVTKQVAYMLDYFLTQLAGPRMQEISNVPEEVQKAGGFDHRQIVEKLVQCYVGIALSPQRNALRSAIASDGHYYSPDAFREISRFLTAKRVRMDILPDLKCFFESVEKTFHARQSDDALFADAPNEFLCQITYELLHQPMLLPGMDGVWVEEEAIRHHQLFDETNPFNRQMLTAQALTAHNNLPEIVQRREKHKEDIDAWKAAKRVGKCKIKE